MEDGIVADEHFGGSSDSGDCRNSDDMGGMAAKEDVFDSVGDCAS